MKHAKSLAFPQFRQSTPNDCGVTVTQMILAWFGIDQRGDTLREEVKQTEEHGTAPAGILAVLDCHQIRYRAGSMTIGGIKQAIDDDRPVLLILQAWTDDTPDDWAKYWEHGHYAIVIGYDGDDFIFADPSWIKRTRLAAPELLKRWHDVGDDGEQYLNYGVEILSKPDTPYDLKETIVMG